MSKLDYKIYRKAAERVQMPGEPYDYMVLPAYWVPTKDRNITYIGVL